MSESIPTPSAIDTIQTTQDAGGLSLQSALHTLFDHGIIDSRLGQLAAGAWWDAAALSDQSRPLGPDDRKTAIELAVDAAVACDQLTASMGSLQMRAMQPGMRQQLRPVLRAAGEALSATTLVWQAAVEAFQEL